MMFALKMAFPMDFFILRGNHECHMVNRFYGLWEECKMRYDATIYYTLNDTFAFLPVAALVGERIFCMHGGLSPALKSLDQIRSIERPLNNVTSGLTADLLWSDPVPNTTGYLPSIRGISYTFGEDTVIDFCNTAGIDMIARAHQVVLDGYEFFAQGRLLTIFSAPRYCNSYNNAAGMMLVREDLTCSITKLDLDERDRVPKKAKKR